MTLTETPVCKFGISAIPFTLKGIDEKLWNLEMVRGANGLLVMFICNHCPYVQAIIDRLVVTCNTLQSQGIGVVAIMPNDVESYPEDSFDNMITFAKQNNFSFPYVIDETQNTARDYDAVCTPDFFGYNNKLELQYRGRFDSAGIDTPDPNCVNELKNAMLQIAATGLGPKLQTPSMGCSIKWR